MLFTNILLAQMDPEITKQITETHEKIMELPKWAYQDAIWLLPIVIAVICILLWQRQKKIAENQVKLARMMEEINDKLDKK